MNAAPPTSAVVLLAPRGGGPIDPAQLTADQIGELLPEPGDVSRVETWFAEAGFDVGPTVGLTFSVTAPPATFERVFGREAMRAAQEYPLDALPNDIRRLVAAVTAPEPIDFGPVSW